MDAIKTRWQLETPHPRMSAGHVWWIPLDDAQNIPTLEEAISLYWRARNEGGYPADELRIVRVVYSVEATPVQP